MDCSWLHKHWPDSLIEAPHWSDGGGAGLCHRTAESYAWSGMYEVKWCWEMVLDSGEDRHECIEADKNHTKLWKKEDIGLHTNLQCESKLINNSTGEIKEFKDLRREKRCKQRIRYKYRKC